jgi:hypothetical protein
MIAIGHRYTAVIISHAKRMLTFEDCPAEFRLQVLQYFDKWVDTHLTAERIALIEPMCAEGETLFNEVRKVGYPKVFDVLARPDVFNAFVALNPSLLGAPCQGGK